MTSAESIEDQLNREDIIPYHNKIYDGNLPWSFIEQFRIAIMYLPVTAHQYPMKLVKELASKTPNDITNRDVGLMMNVIYAIPFASMYETLDEGIEKTMEFDRIKEEYNKMGAAFERKINAKRQRLLSLSGVGNSAKLPPNGMKIIK